MNCDIFEGIIKYTETGQGRVQAYAHTHVRTIRSLIEESCLACTLDSHHCDSGSIPGAGTYIGNMVARSDRWVSPGFSGFFLL